MVVDHARSQRYGRRRPPPLLLIAVAALLLVIGLAVVVIAMRGDETRVGPEESATRAPPPSVAAPTSALPATSPSVPRVATEAATHRSSPTRDAGEDVLPIWARQPQTNFTMPYPDGAAREDPLPPIKIPPWMLPDGGGVAAPVALDGGVPPP